MTRFFLTAPKAVVLCSNFIRAGAMLSGVIIAIGCVGSVSAAPLSVGAESTATAGSPSSEPIFLAQASSNNMARCQQLYGMWSRLNGTSSYSKEIAPDMALEDCRKGNFDAGVAELTQALQRAGITVPPPETAAAH
jgi:hypothetical protein